jgi:hypothetical protein
MIKFSAPPMIIILDVLLAILYVLADEQTPNIKIILPEDVWLEDTFVVGEDKEKNIQHWFDYQTKDWIDIKTTPVPEKRAGTRNFAFSIGNIECEKNKFCLGIPSIQNETKKIYLTGDLCDELSGLISDSCLKFPKQCTKVNYHINRDGHVDRKRLAAEHKIFKFILKDDQPKKS